MADFQINPISNLSEHGLIIDTAPSSIPQNAFSDGKNIRFANGAVNKIEGEVLLNSIPNDNNLDTIYTTLTGNTLGSAKYIAYWPNPNLGGLLGYYVFVMEVLNQNNVPLAHRIYLQDQEGNRVDVTPTGLINSTGEPGFDVDGEWQHTLFSGGFAFIINNGKQKPHFILDTTNDTVIANIGTFNELPGWDSYFANPVIHDDTYGTGDPVVYDLAQKVDFTTQYIEVNGTNTKSVQVGSPAGTGTPNDSNFVPGIYPSTQPIVTGGHFQIYHDNATGTTKVVVGALADGDIITVALKSRNPVNVRCGVVRSFGDLLVAGNLVETDNTTGAIVRQLAGVVRTSDVAVPGTIPNNWNPFEAGVSTADEFTLSDTNVVQDLVSLQGALYIYTTSSIHVMKLTGNTDIPVSFSPVTDTYGTLTTDAVVEYDGKHFVIGNGDIYIFPGHPANIQSVSDNRVREYFFDNLSPLHEENLFVLLNYPQDEIWICYPTIDSVSGECDEALIWNYRDNTWTKRDLNDVISGDMGPVRGGGIPTTEIELTSGTSGMDSALNTGQQEVQTLTVSGQIRAPHTGVGQVQSLTIPTTTQYNAAGFDQLGLTITGDSGPNLEYAEHTITFPNTGIFELSTAIGGGLVLTINHTNNSTATNVTINGSQLFPGGTGTRSGTQIAEALRDYINNITASLDPLYDYTATSANTTVTLVSNVPGNRVINSTTLNAYVTTTIQLTGTGANQDVSVSLSTTNLGNTGKSVVAGTGGASEIPYYTSATWSNFNSTQQNDNNGHVFPTNPDPINRLQSFTGGWTSAGAAGPDGTDLQYTYTVDHDGPLYFLLTGSGGGGADANYGGGSASAAKGTINALANDQIIVTAAAANRFDSTTTSGQPGRASKIIWRRGITDLATIIAPGGKAGTNAVAAGQADEVTPVNAPSGITNYTRFRGEGSTSTVLSGEVSRGGSKNGGRGYFTQNGGGSQYAGRWDPNHLRWSPAERGWGDGTQSHDGTQTWNAIPPGIVFLWQDPIRTTYTVTNNRLAVNHPLQDTLFDFHLDSAGSDTSQDIGSLPSGSSANIVFDGYKSGLSWEAQITQISTATFAQSGVGDLNGGAVAGSSIEVDRVDTSATYSKSINYYYVSGSGGAPPIGTQYPNSGSFSYTWHNRTWYGNQSTWGTSHVRETDEVVTTAYMTNVSAGLYDWRWSAGYSGYTQEPYYFTVQVTGTHRTSANGPFLTGTHYYTFRTTRDDQSYGASASSAYRYTSFPGYPGSQSMARPSGQAETGITGIYDMVNCTVITWFNSYQPGTSSASFNFRWSNDATGPGYDYKVRKSIVSGPASITYFDTVAPAVPYNSVGAPTNPQSPIVLTTSYQTILANSPATNIYLEGEYTVANSTATSVGVTSANTETGVGYYGVSAADSPPISTNIAQLATSNVPAIDIDISQFNANETNSSDLGDHIVNSLSNYKEFAGRDPSVPNQTQPVGALYYAAKTQGSSQVTITRVPISAGSLLDISSTTTGTSTGTNDYYQVPQSSTSGSGTGATFDVSTDGAGNYLVTLYDSAKLNSGGSGYAVNDTITLSGASLGGTSPANDLVLTVTDVMGGGTNDGSLSVTFFTRVAGTDYPASQFGGSLASSISTVSSGGAGTVTAPVVRLSYDGTNKDVILFGTNDETTIATKLALALQTTASWSANSVANVVNATRSLVGPNNNYLSLSVVSDPDNVLPAGFAQTATISNPGFTTSGTDIAEITLSLPQSQFLASQNITINVTGATNAILDSDDIAALIRAQTVDGWTLSGTGSDVVFTTVENYSVNRLDNGLGTGTVQNNLFEINIDDKNGLFRVYVDPVGTTNAVETTPGIAVRYAEPTVYRITYSSGDVQDFIFGGAYVGAQTINTLYTPNIYQGGSNTSTYDTATISTAIFNGIKSYAGQRLNVTRDLLTNTINASPVQYSQTGLWIQNIQLISLGTLAPGTLATTIPTGNIDATLVTDIDFVNTFDPNRPWPIDQVKKGRNYPIFIQTTNNADGTVNNSRIRAADIGYTFGGDPYNNVVGDYYISYVEKRDLPISPEFTVEEVSTMALWTDGGTQQVLGGPFYRATINVRMTGADSTATLANIKGDPDITNQYTVGDDYKIDMRVNGRFTNFRIDDGDIDGEIDTSPNGNKWNISSYQFDVEKGGTR